jgi:hypothetical protein
MSRLPSIGSSVQLFGVGCEGCGHFSGIFSVLAVQDDETTALVVDPEVIQCEGAVDANNFGPMRIDWDPVLQCWEAQCSGHHLVVKLGGHFCGPRLGERPAARPG